MDKGVSIYSKRARVRGFRGVFGPSDRDPIASVGVGFGGFEAISGPSDRDRTVPVRGGLGGLQASCAECDG